MFISHKAFSWLSRFQDPRKTEPGQWGTHGRQSPDSGEDALDMQVMYEAWLGPVQRGGSDKPNETVWSRERDCLPRLAPVSARRGFVRRVRTGRCTGELERLPGLCQNLVMSHSTQASRSEEPKGLASSQLSL